MVRSRKSSSIRIVEKEEFVKIPVISQSLGVQKAHIRKYDDHLTVVNKGVVKTGRLPSRIVIPPKGVVSKPIIAPVKLPERFEEPIITPVKSDELLSEDYDAYAKNILRKGEGPIVIHVIDKPGVSDSINALCPACGKPTGLKFDYKERKDNIDMVTNLACRDCWEKYVRKGMMIIANYNPDKVSPSGRVAIVPEKDFYEWTSKMILPGVKFKPDVEMPRLGLGRWELMDDKYFDALGLSGPGIPLSWRNKFIFKDWATEGPDARISESEVKTLARGWFSKNAADDGLREFIIFKEPGTNKFVVGVTDMADFFIKRLGREFSSFEEAKSYVKKLGGKVK